MAKKRLTSKKVNKELSDRCIAAHYLRNKKISKWDGYDRGNYRSLLKKPKKCKRRK